MKKTSFTSLVVATIYAGLLLHVSADQLYVAQEQLLQVSTVTDGVIEPYANGVGLVYGLAVDGSGNLYAAGAGNDTIYKVNSSGAVSTFASSSVLGSPSGLAFDAAGNLYTSGEGYGGTVNRISPSGVISPVLSGVGGFGLAFDSSGNLYIADGNSVDRMTPSGVVSTFATGFNFVWGLAFHDGNLFVADYDGNSISEVSPTAVVSTFATGLSLPTGIAFDSAGNLFVCSGDGSLHSIAPNGAMTTVATGLDYPTAIVIVAGAAQTETRIISLSESNLNFGKVEIGRSTSLPLIITNNGNSVLTISNITLPAGFLFSFSGPHPQSVSATLDPGAWTNFSVYFTPTNVANYEDTVTINSDATGGTVEFTVSGEGEYPRGHRRRWRLR